VATSSVKVGIIGTGNILGAYVRGTRAFEILDLVACADIDVPKAKARALEFDIPRACTVDELLADPEIQILINLTVPKAHAEVSMAAIAAGKSVQSEKPLAVTREDGKKILTISPHWLTCSARPSASPPLPRSPLPSASPGPTGPMGAASRSRSRPTSPA
jgi:hypothetical protein